MSINEHTLFIISGVSGSGKSTLMKSIMSNELVSFTSRPKREKEINNKDYIFISHEEFYSLLNNDQLIEYTKYGDNYYGLTRQEYESKLSKGKAFFIADINGLKQFKKIHKNCVSIFIYCDKQEAEQRMRKRGETEEFIQKRLSTFEKENQNAYLYDYAIANHDGDFECALEDIKRIVGVI